jgi:ABC-type uncharacterized transport system substrate-binding protein
VKRREFLGFIGGALASWPVAGHAQQAVPVIGFLDSRSPDVVVDRVRGFGQGLKSTGYAEGENVEIVYRFAENQRDRIPGLVDELVRRQVAAIVASGGLDVINAAKAATKTIPILFLISEDPVKLGFVASLARPDGNLTGINFLNRELTSKRLELLRELVPSATRVAVLINPANPAAEAALSTVEAAARTLALQVQILKASTSREIDAAFASLGGARADALLAAEDPFLNSRRLQLSLLAVRNGLPATFPGREYAEVGGLMSYGSDIRDAYRQVGVYAGRILKGARPAEIPVAQATKFELIINHQTARILGLTVPQSLLVAADEVIE